MHIYIYIYIYTHTINYPFKYKTIINQRIIFWYSDLNLFPLLYQITQVPYVSVSQYQNSLTADSLVDGATVFVCCPAPEDGALYPAK